MMNAAVFTASGVAIPADAVRMLDQLCARLPDYVVRTPDGAVIETAIGGGAIALADNRLIIKLQCPTASMLFTIRCMVAENLFSSADDQVLDLSWADGPQASLVPDFREITVVGASDVTPHMRRVTVATNDIAHFARGGLHVRLLIPPKDRQPVWPQTMPDGRIHWPKDEDALVVRAYTIRNLRLDRGEMDIDFVIHEEDNGPGAAWALKAEAGDRAGLMGPGGGGVPEADNLILAGDETALPAIARIAAAMPADARLRIFLEVGGKEDEQPLKTAANCQVVWLHRDAGQPRRLEAIIREQVAADDSNPYVWVACEQAEARAIRIFLKTEIAYDRERFSVAAYWQRH
ncbi:MAG: siderophore-interacting protein [Rhizobium sp.]